jgi:hypothetical protein
MATKHTRVHSVALQRPGDEAEERDEWLSCTPEQRLAAVWKLTVACLGWNAEGNVEPRLQRSVVHIQRPGR